MERNNSQNKRKRSPPSPEESKESFVKKMASGVNGFLQWFNNQRKAHSNGRATMSEDCSDSSSEEDGTNRISLPPPLKKKRYANTLEVSESPTANSTLRHISMSTRNQQVNLPSAPLKRSHSLVDQEEDSEDEEMVNKYPYSKCFKGDHRQRYLSREKMTEHDIETPVKQTPTKRGHNPSLRASLYGSPFYSGRTTYGGAGASTSYQAQPNIQQTKVAVVSQPLSKEDNNVSYSVQLVLDILEKCTSSPLYEAKRIVSKHDNRKDRVNTKTLNKTQELLVPHRATILKIKSQSRLTDGMHAARQIAASQSSTKDLVYHPTKSPSGERTKYLPQSTKLKTSVPSANASETTNAIVPQCSSTPNMKNSIETFSQKDDQDQDISYTFSSAANALTQTPKNGFSPRRDSINESWASKSTKQNSLEVTMNESAPILNPVIESGNTKDWRCEDCWVMNNSSKQKCIKCGGVKSNPLPKPGKALNDCSKDLRCEDCWAMNNSSKQKCIRCDGVKSNPIQNAEKALTDSTKDWRCEKCWVLNNSSKMNCISCTGARPNSQQNPANTLKDVSEQSDWRCKCTILNKFEMEKCAACGGTNPKRNISNPIKVLSQVVSLPESSADNTKNLNQVSKLKSPVTAAQNDNLKINVNPAVGSKQDSEWKCQDCWIQNKNNVIQCVACGGKKVNAPLLKSQAIPVQSDSLKIDGSSAVNLKQEGDWKCQDCWIQNKSNVLQCVACGGSKVTTSHLKSQSEAVQSISLKIGVNPALNLKQEGDWKCQDCWIVNKNNVGQCIACGAKKEKGNSFNSPKNTKTDATIAIRAIQTGWKCESCLSKNSDDRVTCECCQVSRPGKNPKGETSKYFFQTTPQTQFKFGIPSKKIDETDHPKDIKPNEKSTFGNSGSILPNMVVSAPYSTPSVDKPLENTVSVTLPALSTSTLVNSSFPKDQPISVVAPSLGAPKSVLNFGNNTVSLPSTKLNASQAESKFVSPFLSTTPENVKSSFTTAFDGNQNNDSNKKIENKVAPPPVFAQPQQEVFGTLPASVPSSNMFTPAEGSVAKTVPFNFGSSTSAFTSATGTFGCTAQNENPNVFGVPSQNNRQNMEMFTNQVPNVAPVTSIFGNPTPASAPVQFFGQTNVNMNSSFGGHIQTPISSFEAPVSAPSFNFGTPQPNSVFGFGQQQPPANVYAFGAAPGTGNTQMQFSMGSFTGTGQTGAPRKIRKARRTNIQR